jgi:hypothetical protein|tara:strand:- start:6035 stop:6442 length:408 start_codon:yes stop_codon:yes gene_type:complete
MNKRLLLFSFAVLLVLSINAVSGSYFSNNYYTNDFKETTEFKKTTEQRVGDFWNFESTKKTITEKTEVRKRTRTPVYNYYRPYGNYYTSSYNYVPQSSWRFKPSYNSYRYTNAPYNDYYYKPRYDSYLGHYNWRW